MRIDASRCIPREEECKKRSLIRGQGIQWAEIATGCGGKKQTENKSGDEFLFCEYSSPVSQVLYSREMISTDKMEPNGCLYICIREASCSKGHYQSINS